MGGPVQQTVTPEDLGVSPEDLGVPPEAVSRNPWDLVATWLERIADTEFSGDVVILIVLVALAPGIFAVVRTWLNRRGK